jgi:anti-anti-sigma factor
MLRIAVSGKLDANNVGNRASKLYELLEKCKSHVILDVAEVTFLSSLGIRMILSAAKEVKRKGQTLTIMNANTEVLSTLKIAGLDHLLG